MSKYLHAIRFRLKAFKVIDYQVEAIGKSLWLPAYWYSPSAFPCRRLLDVWQNTSGAPIFSRVSVDEYCGLALILRTDY